MKILFATTNPGKIKEIKSILEPFGIDVISLEEEGIQVDIEENGNSFEENAIIKASAIMKLTGRTVLADDSGLEVEYLNNEPGIYSARYLGESVPQREKNQSIIDRLKDVEEKDRKARFVCVIACASPEGNIFTTKGETKGLITREMKGEKGFGYDPIFFVPEAGMTMAEMPLENKNKISHRSKALRLMGEYLNENTHS